MLSGEAPRLCESKFCCIPNWAVPWEVLIMLSSAFLADWDMSSYWRSSSSLFFEAISKSSFLLSISLPINSLYSSLTYCLAFSSDCLKTSSYLSNFSLKAMELLYSFSCVSSMSASWTTGSCFCDSLYSKVSALSAKLFYAIKLFIWTSAYCSWSTISMYLWAWAGYIWFWIRNYSSSAIITSADNS